MDAPPRLDVGVVGVGRAGSVLAAALDRAGHRVVAAHAVSDLSRLRAEALIPGAALVSVPEVLAQAELVLLTVPDDVLPGLVAGLADAGQVTPGQFIMHASGRYGIAVLDAATTAGALPLALHPIMTLTGTSLDLTRLGGCPFGVTAPEVLRPVAEALVVEMGGDPVWVAEGDRALYHAALANASNHLITLATQSMELLAKAGVAEPGRMLAPLMSASLDNALRQGDPALTGPVVRGDAATVRQHLRSLAEVSAQSRAAYLALARLTADRALAAGLLTAARAEALLEVLAAGDDS
ncbi:MAG: hypothetical protein QG597_5 [Actinomycetota bacterium]|nr:hypothetical protein [Actinomycetota bacterium]